MNEIKFKKWMLETGNKPKVVGDAISRLRRVEGELKKINLDQEYKKDKCKFLLSLFSNQGRNIEMSKFKTGLPIGKSYMATYAHAIKQYIQFCEKSK